MPALVKKTTADLQQYDANQRLLATPHHGQQNNFVPDSHENKEINFRDILSILYRRKFSIIIPILFTTAFAVWFTLSTPSTYRANALVQIEKEGAQIVTFGKTRATDAFSSNADPFFRTRYEMLKSRQLSNKVIDELNLQSSLIPPKPKNDKINRTVAVDYNGAFQKNLSIQPIDGTHLVSITYEAPSATEAKNVVTSLIDNYIRTQIETKSETGEYAKNLLSSQLVEARNRLRNSEEALVKYANDKGILGVDDKQTRHVKKLENLDAALVLAEIRRIEAESLYQQMRKSGSVSTVLANSVVNSLKGRLVTLEGNYQEMLKTFKPNYPDMQRLKQQINSTQSKLNREMSTIQGSMKADYLAAKRQEDKIRKELNSFNAKMFSLQDSSLDYNTLKREVDTNGKLYNTLLQRLEEVNVAAAVTTSSISIVEPAFASQKRYRPKPKLNILLGLFSGLLIGLGLAFLREALDQSIKSSEGLERLSGLPVLGSIPKVTKSSVKKHLAMISNKLPQSPVAEAYRILSTNVRFSAGPENERIMLITSANPQEGKSVTATNIACSYAKMGLKVLIVDADIRKPTLHENLNINNKLGLSHYLKGEIDLVGITQPVKDIQGLYAITAGEFETDPVSLLSHERMSYLTTQGGSIFDYVIIDAPPVVGFADALVLSSLASSTLIVAEENALETRTIKHVLKQLGRVKNNVMGFLLVKVKKPRSDAKLYKKYHKRKKPKKALLASTEKLSMLEST